MAIDFYALIRNQFGPEDALTRMDGLEFRSLTQQLEDAMVRYVVNRYRGNQRRAAQELGINRNTIRKRMDRLGIPSNGRGGSNNLQRVWTHV